MVIFVTLRALGIQHRVMMVIAVAKETTRQISNAGRKTERAAPKICSAALGAARTKNANQRTSATRAIFISRMSAPTTTIAKITPKASYANSAASTNARGPMVGNAQEVRNAHPIAARAQLGQ